MKKVKKIVLITVTVIAVGILSLFIISRFFKDPYTVVIKENWDIELPQEGAKELFAYSEPSFNGDGVRYHVIDYPAGNESEKMQDAIFQLEKLFSNAPLPNDLQIAQVNEILKDVKVDASLIADWKRCRLINLTQDDYSELFMFYSSETGTVYVVEMFI